MPIITARSTTHIARCRAYLASILVRIAFAIVDVACKTLNPEHPARTFLSGRVDITRPAVLAALKA